jgi:diguanylate cyclase (GGDEF)-like protein
MDDIRYSELQFLRALANRSIEHFNYHDDKQKKIYGNNSGMYSEMAIALIEDLYVRFENHDSQLLVSRLRNELTFNFQKPRNFHDHQWNNPRETLNNIFNQGLLQPIRITYRGLRRIEELRDLLRQDRILEPFGVLLSMQYFRNDFEDAIRRSSDVSVSLLYADMDHFKRINTEFGQSAGDVVMKAYLEVVRDCLGFFGTGYRGVGDEVAAVIVGQGHQRAIEFAELIRKGVESLHCEYNGSTLPKVTASIGVATTPPEDRKIELQNLVEARKQKAKDNGRNQIVAS